MTITAPFTLVRSNKNRGGGDDDFGLKVIEHAREHDTVSKLRS